MPVYQYTGLNESGKQVKGLKDSDSPRSLRSTLKREGIFLTAFNEEKIGAKKSAKETLSQDVNIGRLRGRASAQDVAITTRQLATLVGAGVPLVEALTALQDQVDHPTLKRIVGRVKQWLEDRLPQILT